MFRSMKFIMVGCLAAVTTLAAPAFADDDSVVDPNPTPEQSQPSEQLTSVPVTDDNSIVVAADAPPFDTTPSGAMPLAASAIDELAITAVDVPITDSETGQQIATVTGVAVAASTTGGNTLDASSGTTVTDVTSGVSTGPASAIGSEDQTHVSQSASTSLSGEATAEVAQVVFVFNIGVANANSGLNGAGSSGSGAITTGSATAVGNSSSVDITQGASADASDTATDSSTQIAITIRLGIALADTGSNSILGAGSGGTVRSGSAAAIGNQSTTDVDQIANAIASGTGHVAITQQVLVLNLGIAVANSGANGVGEVALSLLGAPGQATVEQLLALILPSLIYAFTAGSTGSNILTGDASAIGNQSSTVVRQSATAVASEDGSATIDQNVVVANMGLGMANTGANGAPASPIYAATSELISHLAAFLAAFFAQVYGYDASNSGELTSGSVSLPFGDLLVGIDTTLGGSRVDIDGGHTNGPSARVSQIVAIVNFGLSYANSGQNTTLVLVSTPGEVSSGSGLSGITTGDASARNVSVVTICQLDDYTRRTCGVPAAEPQTPPSPGATDSAAPLLGSQPVPAPAPALAPILEPRGSGTSRLPETGTDIMLLLALGVLLVLAGGSFLRLRQSRP